MSNRLLAGRYELLEKIGDGGMAVVYKAKDKLLNRFIAIKILRPEFTKDASFVENFKRESQAAAGLSHPNIVGVYDVGREGNINYIVMELVTGKPLSDIIAEKAPMDYRTVIDISRQVASALKVAHNNKIIHRDVKPHNIMITDDGIVKLADFGIAKAVNDATLSTNSKVIGSVHYFSPEQARGNYVDERSDIYSLGIVMYEMLTGKVPFDGDNPVTIALKHINEEITPPSELVNGIPPQLERCVLKATSKFQTNRYNSAEELIEELDNIEFVTRVVGDSIFHQASDEVEKKRKAALNDQEDDDDDDDGGGKGGGWKKILAAVLIVAIICLIPLGYYFFQKYSEEAGKAKVPDLSDLTYDQAKDRAAEYGFEVQMGEEVFSNDIDEGRVVNQDPKSGDMLEKGTVITLNFSKGSKDGTIPNVVGMNYYDMDITTHLKSYGYDLGTVTKEPSDEDVGVIISQDPPPSIEREKGTKIDITISDGKALGVVPSVTGLTLDEAKQALRDAGFDYGGITYEESNAYGKGYVMWQQYAANTDLEIGMKIDLQVSKGAPQTNPEEDEKPDDDGGSEEGGENSENSGETDGSTDVEQGN